MDVFKKYKISLAGIVLLLSEAFILAGIVIIAFLSTPAAIGLFLINICLIILLKFFYENIYANPKKQAKTFFMEVAGAIDIVRQRKTWDINTLDFSGDLKETIDNIKALHETLEKRELERTEILNMVNTVASNMEIEKLFEELMPKLIARLNSAWGAFYLANNATSKLELRAAIGFSKNIYNEFDLSIGEGFIGTAALSKEITVIKNIPEDTVFVTKTFLGRITPKNIMLVPVINNDQLIGILCMASIYDYTEEQMEIVNLIKYYLGIALGNCIIYERTKRLTNELQFQNSLIQSLNEELENKVSDRTLFLKNIMDSIRDYSIYVLDRDGIILEWNKGAEIIYGYTEEEIKGQHVNMLYSNDDVSKGKVSARMNSVMKNGHYLESGWRYKKDGTKYYAELSAFALYNEYNELIGMTSVTKDITELIVAKNEAWFRKDFTKKLVEVSKNALIVVDAKFNVEFCNKSAQYLLKMDNLMDVNIQSLFDDEEFKSSIASIQNGRPEARIRLKESSNYVKARIYAVNDELSLKQSFVFYLFDDNDRRMT